MLRSGIRGVFGRRNLAKPRDSESDKHRKERSAAKPQQRDEEKLPQRTQIKKLRSMHQIEKARGVISTKGRNLSRVTHLCTG
jgi:hypothetical protein